MFLFLAKLLKKRHFGDFVVDFGGTFCYAITVADKRFTRDICYKPCLPGCSGGQGELKTMYLRSPVRVIATIHGTVRPGALPYLF